MSKGIIIIGLNGSGKSTICRELAHRLNYKRMDIEEYYFLDSEIPYTVSRTREQVQQMVLNDIKKNENYVLCSVNCNFDEQIKTTFQLAVLLSAPLEVRMERIKQREILRFGKRVMEGGDMYESQKQFHDFVASRSEDVIEKSIGELRCPVLKIDSTLSIEQIVDDIYHYYMKIKST